MSHGDLEDLLDAFAHSPSAAEVEAAGRRLQASLPPVDLPAPTLTRTPPVRWGRILATAAVAMLTLWSLAPRATPAPSVPTPAELALPVSPVPLQIVLPLVSPRPMQVRPPEAATAAPAAPRVVRAPAAPPPPAPLVSGPGLSLSTDAVGLVRDHTAHLRSGVLTYVHDTTLDPGVRHVNLEALQVRLDPVGTAFAAGTRGSVAAIVVADGTVEVRRRGRILVTLRRGEGLLLAGDRMAVRHKRLTGSLEVVLADLDLQPHELALARTLAVDVHTAARTVGGR